MPKQTKPHPLTNQELAEQLLMVAESEEPIPTWVRVVTMLASQRLAWLSE